LVARAADPPQGLVLEEAQQLALQADVELAELVEEERSALGQLDQARLAGLGVGERPPLVAEQLALQQVGRQRRASHVDEGSIRAIADRMNRLGREILAGAALARDQHGGGRAAGDANDQRLDRRDRR
jgi:hypothetical protein